MKDELDDLFLGDGLKPKEQKIYPWSNVWQTAESYYEKASDHEFNESLDEDEDNYNQDKDSFKNYVKAMKLYQDATKLNCLMAYEKLGRMYKEGQGASKDYNKALDYYKDGVRRGNYFCCSEMADIFIENGHTENFHKSYKLLFKNRKEKINYELEEQNNREFWLYCFIYINSCFKYGIRPLKETTQEMTECKYKISDHILTLISFNRETAKMLADIDINTSEKDISLKKLKDVQDWVNENL